VCPLVCYSEFVKGKVVIPPAPRKPEKESQPKATPPVRFATREEFEKADRKVNALHAGLFRRLAK
jgi:hypothetical protein